MLFTETTSTARRPACDRNTRWIDPNAPLPIHTRWDRCSTIRRQLHRRAAFLTSDERLLHRTIFTDTALVGSPLADISPDSARFEPHHNACSHPVRLVQPASYLPLRARRSFRRHDCRRNLACALGRTYLIRAGPGGALACVPCTIIHSHFHLIITLDSDTSLRLYTGLSIPGSACSLRALIMATSCRVSRAVRLRASVAPRPARS